MSLAAGLELAHEGWVGDTDGPRIPAAARRSFWTHAGGLFVVLVLGFAK